jgi:hypothetical protein
LAGRNRPSFLKKQKEVQRRDRAARKREERLARKHRTLESASDPDASAESAETAEGDAGQ